MRRQQERIGFMRRALAVAGAVALLAGTAGADVTTERSASILVFPKVISTATRDTIIQITNTNNSMVHAHCIYVNGALGPNPNPLLPPVPVWTELDFDIWLTRQQPTVWIASEGRPADPTDAPCDPTLTDCYGAGIDPGFVPPVPVDFTGELKCIEVDSSVVPTAGNHLKGEATLVDTVSGDVAKYNGIGILADPDRLNDDNFLCLGGAESENCPDGAEYNGCPNIWVLNHFSEGALDPIAENAGAAGSSSVNTEITVVPCTEDFENRTPTAVTLQFLVTNEFETTFSASTTVTCWGNTTLEEINSSAFTRAALNTDFAQTRIRAVGEGGVLLVAEEFHTATIVTTRTASAAVNAHVEGERAGQDLITLQPDLRTEP